ncbi:putative aminoacrylate hydrolase RutD [Enhygromyxa salina]|uniref:Putative aminoacrylate hydrolase RutD n=1 Tax=Enhygromyxa salina TaxID=215803 RepID=A0A2S9YD59_9BACT|nr:alpha/beta hydrolase [Enhygromyxa salina]PRQ03058.1 putative aminoacrylate hydrolase RutD [Enhygromyxa salina]
MPYATGPREHRIHFRELGSRANPTLVLIQGLILDGRFWFDLPERLAADPETPWHVLVPDNRGVGRSDMPTRPWTMGDMADDVAAMLDAVGVRKAVVAGLSMGGMIAQQVALRHAERVTGLVLMATWPGLPHAKLPNLRTIGGLVGSSMMGGGDVESVARLILPDSELANAGELLSDWFRLMREQPPSRRTFLGQFGAIGTHSTGRRLEHITVPVQVVTGDEDRLVPARNSEILAAKIPRARLEVLPGVAHAIPLMDRRVVHRNAALLRG